jgi:hypothetical protein
MYLLLPAYRETVRAAFPSKLSRYYWENCHVQDLDRQEIVACDSPVDEAEAAPVLAELVKVPGLVHQLRYWVDTLEMLDGLAALDTQIAEDLATKVRAARR